MLLNFKQVRQRKVRFQKAKLNGRFKYSNCIRDDPDRREESKPMLPATIQLDSRALADNGLASSIGALNREQVQQD